MAFGSIRVTAYATVVAGLMVTAGARGQDTSVSTTSQTDAAKIVTGGKKHIDLGLSHVSRKNISAEVYVVDTTTSRIVIYGHNSSAGRISSFDNLREYLDHSGRKLAFATNGGMFHNDYGPVGLLVQDGVERSPINLNIGEGNFFLKPNGVFAIFDDGNAAIVKSESYEGIHHVVRAATQSGPMLVIDGKINSAFKDGSGNRLLRSGVGIIDSHTVAFVISTQPANFRDFASLFRDALGCTDALYLDGVISKFYLPEDIKSGEEQGFGVLIGVTKEPQ